MTDDFAKTKQEGRGIDDGRKQELMDRFGLDKLSDTMAAEIVADQERIEEEKAGRRRNEEDKGQWSEATKKFLNRGQDDK